MFFQLQEALQKVIFYKVFHAGSGSAFIRQLDTHWKKLLDPDPHKMNTDPPSWPSVGTSEKFFIHPLLSRDASDFRLAGYPAFFLYPVSGRIPDKMFEYPAGLGYKKKSESKLSRYRMRPVLSIPSIMETKTNPGHTGTLLSYREQSCCTSGGSHLCHGHCGVCGHCGGCSLLCRRPPLQRPLGPHTGPHQAGGGGAGAGGQE